MDLRGQCCLDAACLGVEMPGFDEEETKCLYATFWFYAFLVRLFFSISIKSCLNSYCVQLTPYVEKIKNPKVEGIYANLKLPKMLETSFFNLSSFYAF